jgi:excisionase family DNA binding protein
MALDNRLESFYCRCMKVYLNASEVAKLLNVDRATVTRWIKKGVIKGVQRPTNTQQWRIPMSSYEDLIKYNESR